MKRKANAFLWWGIGVVVFIILVSLFAIILVAPAILGTFGITVSNDVNHATGGVIGKPAPPPPPVVVKAGQQLINTTRQIVITWNGTQPTGTAPETYYGDDQAFVTVYALNVTNNENVPIVKEVLYYVGGQGGATNYPPIKPWYTNSSYDVSGVGPVTNWAFANVPIEPHESVILYNATFLFPGVQVYLYFENGTVYKTTITYVPNVPI